MRRGYVITRESASGPIYFVRLGLGLFWECTSAVCEAKRFDRLTAASKVLRASGKASQGWRIIPV